MRRKARRVKTAKRAGGEITEKKVESIEDVESEIPEVAGTYRRRYLDRVSSVEREISKETSIEKGISGAEERGAFQKEKYLKGAKTREIGWENIKLLTIVVVSAVVVFFAAYAGVKAYKGYSSKPKIYFCERVDFIKLKPIKKSNRFTRGNITVLYKSKDSFNTNRLILDVYKLGKAGYTPYIKKTIDVRPEWTSFVAKILFDETGTYIVEIKNDRNVLLAQKVIEILPDSYAYKPKLKKG